MIGAQRMMQPAVYGTRINQMSHGHLMNSAQTLVIRMCNDIADQFIVDGYKTIYGVVDDLVKSDSPQVVGNLLLI